MSKKQLVAMAAGLILIMVRENLGLSLGPIPPQFATEVIAACIVCILPFLGDSEEDEQS